MRTARTYSKCPECGKMEYMGDGVSCIKCQNPVKTDREMLSDATREISEMSMLATNIEQRAIEAEKTIASLRSQLADAQKWKAIYKDDYERTESRLKDALDQLRCPECKCGDQVEAECNECGCDSPVCSRDGRMTLAEAYLAEKDRADKAENRLASIQKAGA